MPPRHPARRYPPSSRGACLAPVFEARSHSGPGAGARWGYRRAVPGAGAQSQTRRGGRPRDEPPRGPDVSSTGGRGMPPPPAAGHRPSTGRTRATHMAVGSQRCTPTSSPRVVTLPRLPSTRPSRILSGRTRRLTYRRRQPHAFASMAGVYHTLQRLGGPRWVAGQPLALIVGRYLVRLLAPSYRQEPPLIPSAVKTP
jgi:hypothetical protein